MNLHHFLAASALLAAVPSFAQKPADPELRTKIEVAVTKGFAFLDGKQQPDGCWSSPDYPGLTGLIVQAYLAAPGGKQRDAAAVRKGLAFIRAKARPDGSIFADRMANYNTSVCLSALLRAGDQRDEKLIEAARRFLIGAQTENSVNPANDGGFGYDPANGKKASRSDLDNTVFVLEALRLYRDTRKTQEAPGKDLNWQAAADFLTRCQQLPSHNKEKWVSESESERGGFVYTPTTDGKEPLRSSGTMTYAGVLSFIYADLKKDDPRLLAARDWLTRHYTLEENPGQGAQGLYYYYHLMAKGLAALEMSELKTAEGRSVAWPAELAKKLLALQKADGSWASENGRWMEKDPNLVTTYCLLALAHVHARL